MGRRLFPARESGFPRDLLAGTFDGVAIALGTDEVEGILAVEEAEGPPPEGLPPSVAACLKGVVVAGGERRLLLDARRLASDGADDAARAAGQMGSATVERRDHSS